MQTSGSKRLNTMCDCLDKVVDLLLGNSISPRPVFCHPVGSCVTV